MTPITVQAVLFDLDGTLVDSTASVDRAWTKIAHLMGRDPADIIGRYHGMPGDLTLRTIDPTLNDQRVRDLNQTLLDLETSDTDDVTALPGAIAAVTVIPSDRWAIVTSCSTKLAAARIAAAGIPHPHNIITSDDITLGKPNPEPFQAGARLLRQATRDCLAIEDAPAGVAAAQAAGCSVLGLTTTFPNLPVPTIPNLTAAAFTMTDHGIEITYPEG